MRPKPLLLTPSTTHRSGPHILAVNLRPSRETPSRLTSRHTTSLRHACSSCVPASLSLGTVDNEETTVPRGSSYHKENAPGSLQGLSGASRTVQPLAGESYAAGGSPGGSCGVAEPVPGEGSAAPPSPASGSGRSVGRRPSSRIPSAFSGSRTKSMNRPGSLLN